MECGLGSVGDGTHIGPAGRLMPAFDLKGAIQPCPGSPPPSPPPPSSPSPLPAGEWEELPRMPTLHFPNYTPEQMVTCLTKVWELCGGGRGCEA